MSIVLKQFEIASGSVRGRDHDLSGRNNQDAHHIYSDEKALIAVVCDGCGSGKFSEVGAQIGSRLVSHFIHYKINNLSGDVLRNGSVFESVRMDVTANLRILANNIGGSLSKTVGEYFLFTIIAAIVKEDFTYILTYGDGLFIINGEISTIGPFLNNEPPYLGYSICGSNLRDENQKFTSHIFPTCEVNSLLIGCDGVNNIISSCDKTLPAREEKVGDISQFWENDKYFKNPDNVRRRLSIMNTPQMRIDWKDLSVLNYPGLLPDDTTFVVIRRNKED